jgi:hypothetical protein
VTLPVLRTVAVRREEFRSSLARAKEFRRCSRTSLQDLRPNSAGLVAIHSGSAACVAITVDRLSLCAHGQDPREVLRLLERIPDEGVGPVRRQVVEVLSRMNAVESGAAGLTPREADALVVQAERVVRWVSDHIRR